MRSLKSAAARNAFPSLQSLRRKEKSPRASPFAVHAQSVFHKEAAQTRAESARRLTFPASKQGQPAGRPKALSLASAFSRMKKIQRRSIEKSRRRKALFIVALQQHAAFLE
ncbi:MAG: hypothetical protein PUD68_08375, partial [Clostridiales bacterium]|nr:hypothetical protein [Clostridiales bacterium]